MANRCALLESSAHLRMSFQKYGPALCQACCVILVAEIHLLPTQPEGRTPGIGTRRVTRSSSIQLIVQTMDIPCLIWPEFQELLAGQEFQV